MSPASSPADEREPSTLRAMAVVYAVAIAGSALAALAFIASVGFVKARHLGLTGELISTLIFGAVVMAIAYGAATAGRRMMNNRRMTTAAQRYQRRFFVVQGLYVLTLTLAIFAYRILPHGSPLLWAAAIAPAIAVVAMIVIMGFYLREEQDEFERTIVSEAALWATGALLSVMTLWGFLELFRLAPHVESWVWFVAWAVLLGPAQVLVRRRYQS